MAGASLRPGGGLDAVRRATYIAVAALGAALVLAGCNRDRDRVSFNGVQFQARSDTIGDDLHNFSVAVSPASASLEAAREAGRYEGTRYCIANWGTSRILWSLGPDTDAAGLRIVDDTLTLQGRCDPR